MNWKNALLDQPPRPSQQVLICADGVYYFTYFDAEKTIFYLIEDSNLIFDPYVKQIYWMSLDQPYFNEPAQEAE